MKAESFNDSGLASLHISFGNLHRLVLIAAAVSFCSCGSQQPNWGLWPTRGYTGGAGWTGTGSAQRAPTSAFVPRTSTGSVSDDGNGHQLVYNPFSGRWTYARPGAAPRYNPMENRWELVQESDELKYNAMEGYFQYVPPKAETKYNSMENQFQFANPNDELKYNSMENKWQYVPANSSLRYNPFENKWQYVPDN